MVTDLPGSTCNCCTVLATLAPPILIRGGANVVAPGPGDSKMRPPPGFGTTPVPMTPGLTRFTPRKSYEMNTVTVTAKKSSQYLQTKATTVGNTLLPTNLTLDRAAYYM